MFIRVTRITVKSGQWAAFLAAFESVAIPKLEEMNGFLRVICSGDEASGRANLITMWQTADQGGGSGEGGQDVLLESLAAYLEGQPTSSGYNDILEREF